MEAPFLEGGLRSFIGPVQTCSTTETEAAGLKDADLGRIMCRALGRSLQGAFDKINQMLKGVNVSCQIP